MEKNIRPKHSDRGAGSIYHQSAIAHPPKHPTPITLRSERSMGGRTHIAHARDRTDHGHNKRIQITFS